jgi:spermidine dehydrogenase
MNRRDRQLGLDRDITRRDFLNGTGIAVGGSLLSAPLAEALAALASVDAAAQAEPGYYPPTRSGLRGSHPGSFEVAHMLRDGKQFDDPDDTGEEYDLVVVGGGLSGLAAARFFQLGAGPDARILIVENHDDFGGHAKRNEFHIDGRLLVDLGGTEYIEAPWQYPQIAKSLLEDVGVDVSLAQDVFDPAVYSSLGLRGGIFFDKKTFGADRLVAGAPGIAHSDQQPAYVTLPAELESGSGDPESVAAFLARTPLSSRARGEILQLFCGGRDYLPNKSREEKLSVLRSMNYIGFLTEVVGASTEVMDFFRMWRASYMGNGTDLTPAIEALRYGLPGAVGLGLEAETQRSPEWRKHSYKEDFHFPDGNASIARLLVRRMIPGVAPGNSMHDIVSARFDYNRLDQEGSAVRLRLNATAVRVRHLGDPAAARQVEVTYVQSGSARRIRSRYCIMACYHAIIPYLCPELPAEQSQALERTIRMPLVSTNVLVRNWRAFEKLGVFAAYCPGSYFSDIRLTYPLRFADYTSPKVPSEPTTVHLYRIPLPGGMPAADQFRAGRYELLGTTFETFERNIREQLSAMLDGGGFDARRDIEAITVNRWPHGYAVGYDYDEDRMNYFSEPWPDDRKTWLIGRQQFGRIAIANSDAAAMAMTEAAIQQADRAIREILNDT